MYYIRKMTFLYFLDIGWDKKKVNCKLHVLIFKLGAKTAKKCNFHVIVRKERYTHS